MKTTSKNKYLEFIRGFAALLVFITHLSVANSTLKKWNFNFISNWGTEAVMVFFIMSGIVINIANTRKPKSPIKFLHDRFVRLYPQFLVGLLLAFLAASFVKTALPPLSVIIGNVFMLGTLQGYIVPVPLGNTALWSLSFEIVFYLLFSPVIKSKRIIYFWAAIALGCIPLYYVADMPGLAQHIIAILSFSVLWLIGYFLYQYRNRFPISITQALISISLLPLVSRIYIGSQFYDPLKFILFALTSIPFFLFIVQDRHSSGRQGNFAMLTVWLLVSAALICFSNSSTYSKAMYIASPGIVLTMFIILKVFGKIEVLKKGISLIGTTLGKYSYSIYIIHYPIIIILAALIHNTAVLVFTTITFVYIFSFLLENYYQLFANRLLRMRF